MSDSITAREWKIIIAIIAISFIQGLQYGVSPILNAVSEHFADAPVSMVQMLITAPAVLAIVVSLISGWLVTKISKKKLLLFAALVSGISGFMPFMADSFALLFASRMIYGIPLGIATALNGAVVAEFFKGNKRTKVMGIQGASVGLGMVVITTLAGNLGSTDFTASYWVNLIGFISMILIALLLPDTGVVGSQAGDEPIQINGRVIGITLFTFLEFFFLITFSTNIAMHVSNTFANGAQTAGTITGVFSAAQILTGLVLGVISRFTGKMTMPVAMVCFAAGALLLIVFPSNMAMLVIGAVLCGFSQGIFIPTAYVEAANAVNKSSATMASALVTVGSNAGQLLSAVALNGLAAALFGQTTTTGIYTLAAIGMMISAVVCSFWMGRKKAA